MIQGAFSFGEPRPKSEQRLAFEKFHEENPHIYHHLVGLCRILQEHGHNKGGIRMVWEKLRWDSRVHTIRIDDYKLNNNHCGFYARLVMDENDDLDDFFDLREMKH